MRLGAAAGALFPLAGEEKKSKSEAERHCLHSVTLAARARQRLQRELELQPPTAPALAADGNAAGSKPLEHRSDKSSIRVGVSI
jgi:hypothetical protein